MNNLEKIRNIKEVGFIFKKLNVSNSEIIDIIDNITSFEELVSFPSFIGKYINGEILNILSKKYLNGKSFLSCINKEIIYNLPNEEFKKLEPESLEFFTAEQLKNINRDNINYLILNNRLQYLPNDVLKELNEEKLNFSYKYSMNFISNRPVFDIIKTQIESLDNKNKLHFLNKNIMQSIANDKYLVEIVTNFSNFNLEQFKLFKKNFKYIKPEVIATISPENLNNLENSTFKLFTNQQLQYLTSDQLNFLIKNDKIKFFDSDLIKYIDEKTITNIKTFSIEYLATVNQNILNALNDKILNFIAEEKTDFINTKIEERQSIIAEDIKNILKKDTKIFSFEDINFAIDNFLRNEDYVNMLNYCFDMSRNNVYKQYLKTILVDKINICEKDNIYGNIDKIEMLKTLVLIENNKNYNREYYFDLVNSIKNLSKIKPRTIDGYISRANTFSKLIQENNFDLDFQEKIAEENLKNIKNCIKSNYSLSERKSIDTHLKELKAKALMEYANILAKKYNINPDKFKYINDNDKSFLTKNEAIYYKSIEKAIELKPDIESTVKSWATPILKITVKGIITYMGTKISNGKTSAIIGTIGAAAIANDIKNEFDKKNYFLNPIKYHKKEKNRKENIFVKSFRKIKDNVANAIFYPFNRIKSFFIKNNDLKGFDRKENEKSLEVQNNIFKNNIFNNSFNTAIEQKICEHNEVKSKLQDKLINNNRTRQSILINNYINLKKKALEIQTQRKIENLYIEYPQFRKEDKIFNYFINFKNTITGITKGLFSSFVDVTTFGVGSDFYQKYVTDKNGDEKIKNELELKTFQNKVNQINKNYFTKLNEINQEECKKLSSLNNEDKVNFDLLLSTQEEELKNYRNDFLNIFKSYNLVKKDEILIKNSDAKEKNVDKKLFVEKIRKERMFKNYCSFSFANR